MMATGKPTDVMAKEQSSMEMVKPISGISTVIKDLVKVEPSTSMEDTTKETG